MAVRVTFTPDQLAEIVRAYAAGDSVRAISERYGCSRQPVEEALRREGVFRGHRRALTEAQELEAVERRTAGESLDRIASGFGCGTHAVVNALERRGVYEPRRRGFSAEETQDIVRRYLARESANRLAKEYGRSNGTVIRLLTEQGVYQPLRFQGFSPEDRETVFSLYRDGVTTSEIARQFQCAHSTVKRILQHYGVWVSLTPLERVGKQFTMDQKRDMVTRYNAGDSIYKIAKQYDGGVPHTIWKILRASNVEFRDNAWKGGRVGSAGGYTALAVSPDDPYFAMARVSGYVLEHRLVVARSLGRPLIKDETVHHINGDRLDNRLENLQLRQGRHGKGARFVCKDCGSHNVEAAPLT